VPRTPRKDGRSARRSEGKKPFGQEAAFELTDSAVESDEKGRPSIRLRPHSDLFTAYQHSLNDNRQLLLRRWANGDFRAGDGKLRACEGTVKPNERVKQLL